MRFLPTSIPGAYLVAPELMVDERGFFARTFCVQEFKAHGLNPDLVQCNISYSAKKGTLRGMHYQTAPYAEVKLVRVTRGEVYDVIIDLRPESPQFGRWFAVELSAENRLALYVPAGCAHGFQTLVDDVEVFYQMGERYHPEAARGVRWDDPAFAIDWPDISPIISERDRCFPLFYSKC